MLSPSLVIGGRSASLVIAFFGISVNSAVSQVEISEATPSGEGLGKAGPGRIVIDHLRQSPFARPDLGAPGVRSLPSSITLWCADRLARNRKIPSTRIAVRQVVRGQP
jgi:hypothetical protein